MSANETNDRFLRILILDVDDALQRHRLDGNQQNRRTLLRTTFAAIEGVVWSFRKHVTDIARSTGEMTQIDEFAFSETNYQINDQGKVVRQPRFVSLQQSIRLTTRLASRLNTKVDIRFNTSGWDALLKSVKVRNRITHPKSKDDLHIGDAEAEACLDALFWLLEAIANGMGAANAALALHTADFRNTLNALNRGDTKTWTAYREALLADDD